MLTSPSKSTKTNRKENISFKRRIALYYWRVMLYLKISLLLLISVFLFTNIFSKQKKFLEDMIIDFSATHGFVLKNVILQGQENVTTENILNAINIVSGEPIFKRKISDIKQELDNNPWIKSSIVERRLPDTIYVAVFERMPIAIWQMDKKLYLIDEDGLCISPDNIKNFPELIQVVGDGANIYAKQLLNDLKLHPKILENVVAAVRFGNRRWNLRLKEKIIIKMPEHNFAKAYDYLSNLDQSGKLFKNNYSTIDLRNEERYYFEKNE